MKVVHVGKYFYPDKGGIETVTRDLALAAVVQGFDVEVVCFGAEQAEQAEQAEMSDGVSVRRFRPFLRFMSQPLSFRYIFRALISAFNSDIIHIHLPNLLGLIVAIFSLRGKIVLHWHSDIINKGFLRFFVAPVEYLSLIRASVIIATSENYATESPALRRFSSKVRVLPIGIEIGKEPFIDGRESHQILAVGRLVSYKGFDVLIRSMPLLDQKISLVVVGQGPEKDRLVQLAEVLGVQSRVDFRGRVSDEHLESLYNKSTVFCLPSVNKAEAFGVVLLEAMKHGLPIVSSRVAGSGMSWVNADGISGIQCEPNDPVCLANALDRIINDRFVRLELSKGARHRVKSLFDQTIIDAECISLYRSVLK